MNALASVEKLENREGIERIFFELASESRLSILRQLEEENCKLNDIARKLDLTPTEAFRQLQRLTEACLVQKLPDGTYGTTQLSRLALQFASSLEFIFRHKEYFLTHDVFRLPPQFIDRIGELSKATLHMGTIENIDRGMQMVKEANEYMWGIGESSGFKDSATIINEQIRKGVKFKILGPEGVPSLHSTSPPALSKNLEVRVLCELPAILLLNEKEAVFFWGYRGGHNFK